MRIAMPLGVKTKCHINHESVHICSDADHSFTTVLHMRFNPSQHTSWVSCSVSSSTTGISRGTGCKGHGNR